MPRSSSPVAGGKPNDPVEPPSSTSPEHGSSVGILIDRLEKATRRDILIFLIAFRIINALSIKTFFQPDEYFQSLEPAWQIAFGEDSGAWITWEWKHHLRSAIHPVLFAVVYWVAAQLSRVLHLSPSSHADLLLAAPKIVQAICAALGDYFTWRLASVIYGEGSDEGWAALALTIINPWQWFCSTRTLSNCLETTLTVAALNFWPWHWTLGKRKEVGKNEHSTKQVKAIAHDMTASRLRPSLVLAAFACVLRPTNLLIWLCLAGFLFLGLPGAASTKSRLQGSVPTSAETFAFKYSPTTGPQRRLLVKEGFFCGSFVLLLSTCIDLLYYKTLTFPPGRFLYFNIAQSLAVFYGTNRWDYYATEGFPLLLTTILPFGLTGLYQSLVSKTASKKSPCDNAWFSKVILKQLALVVMIIPTVLSTIAHKEVRFIYPLLPILHVLAASPFHSFFLSRVGSSPRALSSLVTTRTSKRLVFVLFLSFSIIIAFFSTRLHQTAPLSVLEYLRNEHIKHDQPTGVRGPDLGLTSAKMTVGFLMPCHTTPWRSHLVFPTIDAWALGCEPPVNMSPSVRAVYRDEADRFYDEPKDFLTRNLGNPPMPKPQHPAGRIIPNVWAWVYPTARPKQIELFGPEAEVVDEAHPLWTSERTVGSKAWPMYLVFFAEKETLLGQVLAGSAYQPCWRGFNSYVHDDWRRQGDMIVWCVPRP